MKNAEAAALMTPGSVWFKENGAKSILICVTNGTLSARTQEQYPPQAVFMDEEGDVFNRPVSEFLASRKFHNVVPEIEAGIEAVLGYRDLGDDEGEEGDDTDLSDLIVESDEEETAAEVEAAELADPAPMPEGVLVQFAAPESIAAQAAEVAAAVVGYQELPVPSFELTDHVFVIDPSRLKTLTIPQVNALFDPDSPELIDGFTVRGLPAKVWQHYLGAYNQLTASKAFLAIHLGVPVGEALTGDALDSAIVAAEALVNGAAQAASGEVTIAAEVSAPAPAAPAVAAPANPAVAAPASPAVTVG